MKRYAYVGPEAIRLAVSDFPEGTTIHGAKDLLPFADGEPRTFVIDSEGDLLIAERRSEHVAAAGGGNVLSAGEITAVREGAGVRVVEVSNQSTGYCPEPESWPAVASALDRAGIPHPGRFTYEAIFRRCPKCSERNLVKDEWFVCALCEADLPRAWNFAGSTA